jgi:hypothetical protein
MRETHNQLPLAAADLAAYRVVNHRLNRGKAKVFTTACIVLTLLLSMAGPGSASAADEMVSAVVDVAVARPISLAWTIVGSALFVVSLPVAAASGSMDKTAHTLVVGPARDTFLRPVGALDEFMNY